MFAHMWIRPLVSSRYVKSIVTPYRYDLEVPELSSVNTVGYSGYAEDCICSQADVSTMYNPFYISEIQG